jgi:carbonic anhydrase
LVLTAIGQLGDFNTFLLALTFAGVLQIIIGACRAGFFADYVPSNVVQGLLCAIGLLLIAKQLPLALSFSADLSQIQSHLLGTTEGFSVQPIYNLLTHIDFGATLISVFSLLLLIFFDKTKNSALKNFPAPIIVVILGIVINEIFTLMGSGLSQDTPQLVNIPQHAGFIDLLSQLQFPNWHSLSNPKVYLYAALLAIVASLETLLNVKAGEKLDKQRRYCSKDRELLAQGFGNVTAGLIGGIPITSVIVRTSVNIQAGAKTKLSTVLHGLFLLLSILLIPTLLNKIPLASLAAILIFTGYKLNKPQIYQDIFQHGMDRFIPFIATIVSILMFNLLEGILIGLAISLFYILRSNSQARLDIIQETHPTGMINRLILPQQITFLNKASLTAELESIPRNSHLIIDASSSDYIDKEIIELIDDFKTEQAPLKQIAINLVGLKDNYSIHNVIDFINVTTFDIQANLTPHEVLRILMEGNDRFMKNIRIHRNSKVDIKNTADSQHPIAIVLGCIDSRVPVETVFDMGFGDLFCVRVAGNVVNDDVLASVEYACNVIGAKLVVVLGHTRCGAIQAACENVQQGHITQLLEKIKPAIRTAEKSSDCSSEHHNSEFLSEVTDLNIANTLQSIYSESPALRDLTNTDQIGLVGAIYDVQTGQVHFKDYSHAIQHIDQETGEKLTSKLQQVLTLAVQGE